MVNFLDLSNISYPLWQNVIFNVTDIQTGGLNESWKGYDDIQWWSLSMIRIYEYMTSHNIKNTINPAEWYLNKAMYFYDYVYNNSWDDITCLGGLWWNRPKTYKNAITNELGLVNSAKLYSITKDIKYMNEWNNIWNWFWKYTNSGKYMINQQWLINDGLSVNNNDKSECYNNNQTEWSYNQGVILGGLYEMFLINNDYELINVSLNIIQSVIKYMTNDGILHENESDVDVDRSSDQTQFKGIFMRYLMYLYKNINLTKEIKTTIAQFVLTQMNGTIYNCMNPKCVDQFGDVWTISFEKNAQNGDWGSSAISQTIAIDLWNWAFVLE